MRFCVINLQSQGYACARVYHAFDVTHAQSLWLWQLVNLRTLICDVCPIAVVCIFSYSGKASVIAMLKGRGGKRASEKGGGKVGSRLFL